MFVLHVHGISGAEKISGGNHERFDVLGAFDFLKSLGIAVKDVGVLGLSLGAGTSTMAVAAEPEITDLFLDSPYAKASELIAQETARGTPLPEWFSPNFIPKAMLCAGLLYDIDVGRRRRRPWCSGWITLSWSFKGPGDTRIPPDYGQRVYDAAPRGSTVWVVDGSDHVDAYIDHPEEHTEQVMNYLKEWLGVNQQNYSDLPGPIGSAEPTPRLVHVRKPDIGAPEGAPSPSTLNS